MNTVLLPTTKAQVSGHKFLMRRVEHGVVLGDIRMIADPLGARRRATLFGVLAAGIIALGSGALALFRPEIDPGDASVIVADSGALYVRINQDPQGRSSELHPVANLASARLIVGEAVKPARASDSVLAELSSGSPIGVPVGISDAPGRIAPAAPSATWTVCHDGVAVEVSALDRVGHDLRVDQALLAESAGQHWLVTNQGRLVLPAANDPLGRAVRRRIGIEETTPRWRPPAEVLQVVPELPPLKPAQGKILRAGEEYWLFDQAKVSKLTRIEAEVFADVGLTVENVDRAQISTYPDGSQPGSALPTVVPEYQRPETVCIRGDGSVGIDSHPAQRGVPLAGESVATRYAGPSAGAVGVDTGHGWVAVSEHGMVHRIGSAADAAALGFSELPSAPWSIIRLLPEGSELSRQQALKALA